MDSLHFWRAPTLTAVERIITTHIASMEQRKNNNDPFEPFTVHDKMKLLLWQNFQSEIMDKENATVDELVTFLNKSRDNKGLSLFQKRQDHSSFESTSTKLLKKYISIKFNDLTSSLTNNDQTFIDFLNNPEIIGVESVVEHKPIEQPGCPEGRVEGSINNKNEGNRHITDKDL
jgi:hypothetical protein